MKVVQLSGGMTIGLRQGSASLLLLDGYAWVCYWSGGGSSGDMQAERIRENVL